VDRARALYARSPQSLSPRGSVDAEAAGASPSGGAAERREATFARYAGRRERFASEHLAGSDPGAGPQGGDAPGPGLPIQALRILQKTTGGYRLGHQPGKEPAVELVVLRVSVLRLHLEALLAGILASPVVASVAMDAAPSPEDLPGHLKAALGGRSPSGETLKAARALLSSRGGFRGLDHCVRITVDSFVACLYRRLRLVAHRDKGYREAFASTEEFNRVYGEEPLIADGDEVPLPAALADLVDGTGVVRVLDDAAPPECSRVLLPVFPEPGADRAPRGIGPAWVTPGYDKDLARWVVTTVWGALGVRMRSPVTLNADTDEEGSAFWAIDTTVQDSRLTGFERLPPRNFRERDCLLRLVFGSPIPPESVPAIDRMDVAVMSKALGRREAQDPAKVFDLVDLTHVSGGARRCFGLVIDAFPVGKVPDVFLALCECDLQSLVDKQKGISRKFDSHSRSSSRGSQQGG